ncbi:MAG: NAD-dependent protein deacylase [Eubacteriales bacterium]|nr:NAD-dependent protein deacylase [Eubacteriales bacterium]
MNMKEELNLKESALELKNLLEASKYTVFFGGAGVSTASNIPDFRGAQGLYTKNLAAEEILTPRFLCTQPEAYYDFYRKYFMLDGIQPNPAHTVLARLEAEGLIQAIITQNVDGLHQAAGSKKVFELHGSGQSFYCNNCQREYSYETVDKMPKVPRCESCGGIIRSKIVLYEEGLPEAVVQAALVEIMKAELLIVGGTSLTVYPAAGFINYQRRGGKLVLINKGESHCPRKVDLFIDQPIAELFLELEKMIFN